MAYIKAVQFLLLLIAVIVLLAACAINDAEKPKGTEKALSVPYYPPESLTDEKALEIFNRADVRIKFASVKKDGTYTGDANEMEYNEVFRALGRNWVKTDQSFRGVAIFGGFVRPIILTNLKTKEQVVLEKHDSGILIAFNSGLVTAETWDLIKIAWKTWTESRSRQNSRSQKPVPPSLEVECIRWDYDDIESRRLRIFRPRVREDEINSLIRRMCSNIYGIPAIPTPMLHSNRDSVQGWGAVGHLYW